MMYIVYGRDEEMKRREKGEISKVPKYK
jgi:hypothetical protein